MKDWKTMKNSHEKRHAYMASREWAVKKEAIRKRSGGTCEHCKTAKGTQTHHTTYIRLYNEPLMDLMHVCGPCHEFLSGKSSSDPSTKAVEQLDADITLQKEIDKFHEEFEQIKKAAWSRSDDKKVVIRPSKGYEDVIKSVYLAGKMTKNSWRGDTRLPTEKIDRLPVKEAHIKLKNGKRLDYTGPYTLGCDHGCYHQYPHAWGAGMSGPWTCPEKPDPGIADLCLNAINRSDLVFAWIDTEDCFGTIAEIGYAIAKRKIVYIAGPSLFRELWFSYQIADKTLFYVDDPWEAFNMMVVDNKGHSFEDYYAVGKDDKHGMNIGALDFYKCPENGTVYYPLEAYGLVDGEFNNFDEMDCLGPNFDRDNESGDPIWEEDDLEESAARFVSRLHTYQPIAS